MTDNVLSSRENKALAALLASRSTVEAAEACGLAPRTLARYLEKPEFRAALLAKETEAINNAGRRLLDGQEMALDALEGIILNSRREGDRRLAAVAWMDLVLKWRELRNVELRLSALESEVFGEKSR